MANLRRTSLLQRLWQALAQPRSAGWLLLAAAAAGTLSALAPSSGTLLVLRVVGALVVLSTLAFLIEHLRADRAAAVQLAAAEALRGVPAPFFRDEFAQVPGGRPRVAIVASSLLVALPLLVAGALLLRGAYESRPEGELTLLPGASSESWLELAPQSGIQRSLGTQLTLERAGVRDERAYADLVLTDPVSQARAAHSLTLGESARVGDHVLTLNALHPLGGLGEVQLEVAREGAEFEALTLFREGEAELQDGTTLRWLGAEANRLDTLGAAVLVEFETNEGSRFRRWLYASSPELSVRHGGALSVRVASVARPAAVELQVRPAGGVSGMLMAAVVAVVLVLLFVARRFATPTLVGRSGDYVFVGRQSRVSRGGPPGDDEVAELEEALHEEARVDARRFAATTAEEARR